MKDKKVKFYKYSGTLETYFETGFEQLAIIVHDDRGLTRGHSFNNKTKEWDGPMQDFKSLEWAIFLDSHHVYHLKVFDKDLVTWEGIITQDREKLIDHKFNYSFLPMEIEVATWLDWCKREVHVELSTNKKVLAEDKNYKREKKTKTIRGTK